MMAAQALDDLLAALQRGYLSPMELRMLLRLVEREATHSELADVLDDEPETIASATRRLSRRGLIREQFDEDGRQSRFVLSITGAGFLALAPLAEWIPKARERIHAG
jgi:DNA-binding MarR family transcriptional regulator